MKYQKCPVCEGRGNVPVGFYNPYGLGTVSSTTPEECKTCHGSGIILEAEDRNNKFNLEVK